MEKEGFVLSKKTRDSTIHGKETVQLYWNEVKKYKPSFFIMSASIPLASILLDTVLPYFLSLAIGTFSSHDANFNQYLTFAIYAASIGVLANLVGYQMAARHESRVRNGLVRSSMRALLQKDSTFFSNQKIGALTGKYIDFVNGHIELQALLTMRIISFGFNVTLGLILISLHTPLLAGIVCLLVVWLLFQVKYSRRLRDGFRKDRKRLIAEANGTAADIITNYSTVKTFASEEEEIATLDAINEEYRKAYIKDFQGMSIDGTLRVAIMNGVQIVAVAVIAGLLSQGKIDLGIAIFTIAYLQRLSTQLFMLGEMIFGYDKVMLQAAPMTEILTEPPVVTDNSDATLELTEGTVVMKGVTYAYQDDKKSHILDDFNLVIPAGQKVGLVGHSGAGKTTVTRLLLRFDDIDKGEILIDGQNIANVTQQSLRRSIAYVPQEPMLFHRTLRENIAYGKTGATDAEVIQACKQANAWEFTTKLPNGLDTIVGERGVKLSGGQRQRIAIARALLKDAPILILDEATSALDSESEAKIQQSFNQLMSGRTSIVVAHRLSTLRHMDRIIVMDSGKIIEDGSHAELLARGGLYAKFWKRQSGGFIEE